MSRDFSKYYYLEHYLFTDIHNRFNKHAKIDAVDFYMLLAWKANRAKNKHKRRLAKRTNGVFATAVKEISKGLCNCTSAKERLALLMGKWGFRLPTSTAILTVLYPNEFTIYDERVCRELEGFQQLANWKFSDDLWNEYQRFIEAVRNEVPEKKCLRDKDRYIWGRSFYNDARRATARKIG
jgi:hypothetical protein